MKPIKQWQKWSIVVVLLLVVVGAVVTFYTVVSTSLEAEVNLHAHLLTLSLVEQFCLAHPGEWPKSWQDLHDIQPRHTGPWSWPKDETEIQSRIQVDFSMSQAELSKLDAEHFTAIVPKGPYYEVHSFQIEPLLKVVRENQKPQEDE